MRVKYLIVSLCLAFTSALFAGEVDDILKKHWEAQGGEKALLNVTSYAMEGVIAVNTPQGPMEIPLSIKMKKENKLQIVATFQGMAMTQCLNGESGWKINPMMGSSSAEDLTEQELKELKKQADWMGDLWDYKSKGISVEYKGKVDVEGTEAFHLASTNKDGEVTDHYIDTENYILIKTFGSQIQNGMKMEADTIYSDYKEVGGIVMAHSLTIQPKGGMPSTELRFESIEVNSDISDALFEKPSEAEKAP